MSLRKNIRNKAGSYIVEAALTLPIFIVCVVALALIINIISICENIGFVTSREVRDIDMNSYSSYSFELLSDISLCKFIIEDSVMEENPKLTKFKVTNLDYLYSYDNINNLIGVDTKAIFKVENPLGIYGEIQFTQGLLTRAFVGDLQEERPLSEDEFCENSPSETVIIFPKYGTRYHLPDCRYVKREYKEEKYNLKMEMEDAKRKGYTPCMICGGGKNE